MARMRQPHPEGMAGRAPLFSDRGKAPMSSSDPSSSSPTRSSPTHLSSTPSSPPDLEGWQKPSKVAHRRSPEASALDLSEGGGSQKDSGSFFAALADSMQLVPLEEGHKDQQMVEVGTVSLKRSRSPSRPSSPSSIKSSSAPTDQVSPPTPTVNVNEGGKQGGQGGLSSLAPTGSSDGKKREVKKEWRRVEEKLGLEREVLVHIYEGSVLSKGGSLQVNPSGLLPVSKSVGLEEGKKAMVAIPLSLRGTGHSQEVGDEGVAAVVPLGVLVGAGEQPTVAGGALQFAVKDRRGYGKEGLLPASRKKPTGSKGSSTGSTQQGAAV